MRQRTVKLSEAQARSVYFFIASAVQGHPDELMQMVSKEHLDSALDVLAIVVPEAIMEEEIE